MWFMNKPQNKNLTRKNAPSTAEQTFSALAATQVAWPSSTRSVRPGTGATPETATPQDKPVIMLKRIGTTTYQVSVFTSNTSKETISVIKNDVESEVVGS
jgi:hypothetical protein